MESALISVLLVFLLGAASAAVFFDSILNSIISLGVFGALMAAVFVVYQAPDVAMAQAVVGAGLITSFFVVTLSKTSAGAKSEPE